MSRGRRYNNEPKLNMKKVVAVILIIVVMIVFIIAIKKLIGQESTKTIATKSYFSLYSNDKWGVIDSQANIVIEPTYEEMIIIPDNTKALFICTENVDYTNNTYTTKILNANGKEILKKYEQVQAIENYDENNNLWYEQGVLKFQRDGKYGLINTNGKILVEPEFDSITSLKGTKGAILTTKDSKVGLINLSGEEVIPNEYEQIRSLGEDTNLYIVKNSEGKYGVYGKTQIKYEDVKQLNNKDNFCVKEDGKYKLINNKEETLVSDLKFSEIKQVEDNIVVYKKDNKFGAVNLDGEEIVKCEYNDLTYTCNDMFIAKKDNSYGIINKNKEEKKTFTYKNIQFYKTVQIYELEPAENEDGLNYILNNNLEEITKGIVNDVNQEKSYIKVWKEEGYAYYNLNGEEQNPAKILTQNNLFLKKESGKYGFVDKDGKVVVDCIYDDAKEQNKYGFSAIKKDGKWGALDKDGNIINGINDNLDENLLIDYIGKYHLGKDINLLYYTD